jgi:hypothetical protein
MREEFIEIVDEITGDGVTHKRHYDEVKARLEQNNAPAAARQPDEMIINGDSDLESEIFPHEDAEIPDGDKKPAAKKTTPDEQRDGDKKMAAVDKTPDDHRKEVAKVMASLRQTPTLYDMEKQVALKEPPKKPNEAQSKEEGLQLLSPLAKKLFQYFQAGNGEGGRNTANRKSVVFPL